MCDIRRRQFFPAVLIALMMQAVACASHHHMSHDVAQLNFFDFTARFVSG